MQEAPERETELGRKLEAPLDQGADDERYMRLAIEEAQGAMAEGEVPVGCILVDRSSGEVLVRAGNSTNRSRNGTRHCEFVAANALLKEHGRAKLLDSCLYVTLEPCIMCAGALQHLGVPEVVFGAPNARFGGCGGVFSVHELTAGPRRDGKADAPRSKLLGFSCRGGVLAEEAVELLRVFYATGNPNAPEEKRHRPLGPTPDSGPTSDLGGIP
ncbi:unnamed protein product [Polarella glacialis]|uniref:CMP/dCMP-type deaminase domain-containing protein n=1 Tax=Polarella glacialis TaxID=89957 RepID=A0A813JCG7_POLGL|nr:unnamed protein product [Polarella glacialis]|mmetsp:Transcript_23412/g.37653  ORF Transcript_23412/g.37653 Transcript_23412/m.37653 type:complete len:214 (-) Transcript_23412:27-668(-)